MPAPYQVLTYSYPALQPVDDYGQFYIANRAEYQGKKLSRDLGPNMVVVVWANEKPWRVFRSGRPLAASWVRSLSLDQLKLF